MGSHLTDKLMMDGHEVTVVDNFFTGRKRNVEHWIGHENFELINHDVVEPLYIEGEPGLQCQSVPGGRAGAMGPPAGWLTRSCGVPVWFWKVSPHLRHYPGLCDGDWIGERSGFRYMAVDLICTAGQECSSVGQAFCGTLLVCLSPELACCVGFYRVPGVPLDLHLPSRGLPTSSRHTSCYFQV